MIIVDKKVQFKKRIEMALWKYNYIFNEPLQSLIRIQILQID